MGMSKGGGLDTEQVYKKALELIERSQESYFATIDGQGRPAIRGMMIWRREGLKKVWYAGFSYSRKMVNLGENPAAGVYMWGRDGQKIAALALTGSARVLRDQAARHEFWESSLLEYYTGPDDPDYCIIEFTASECDFHQDNRSYVFAP